MSSFCQKETVRIEGIVPRTEELRFANPIYWAIHKKEQWAIVGPNGAGKTLLADFLQCKYAFKEGKVVLNSTDRISDAIKSIAFKDIYSLANCKNTYYQQRWHSTETDDFPTVEETLKDYPGSDLKKVLDVFDIADFMPKKLIFLSSGELRKYLIVRKLLSRPQILILDNPFIGLDAPSRGILVGLLQKLALLDDIQVILLLSDPAEIPEMVTHVLPVANRNVFPPMKREEFLQDKNLLERLFPTRETAGLNLPVDENKKPSQHEVTFRMEHVTVRYGSRTILKNLDWEVRNNEKWALSGPNGAGKSTLLSLVYADNPQSYANTLYLFDHRRGTGESIWDIKRRIGYVSPEMHLYYMENVPTLHIVGSGYFDSVGLYHKCNKSQEEGALQWMDIFGIKCLKDRPFLSLSMGEQRLALLARAFVKDPDLIILDEPMHGLDASNKRLAESVIEKFCSRPGKTLVYVTHYLNELPGCISKHFELKKVTQ